MIQINYQSWLPERYARKWRRHLFRLREWLNRDLEIIDGDSHYRFRCETWREFNRSRKMFKKEPGTCEWIKTEVKSGEIFYDIGANIGTFTVLAARRTGPTGKVFAFEPHSANFTRLIDNIVLNNLQDIVVPCNFALHNEDGIFPFNYTSSQAATSDSQLSPVGSVQSIPDHHAVAELKYAVSLDNLIMQPQFAAPQHVKIDVDGNELLILQGMSKLLATDQRPRSIQIEINKSNKAGILSFMKDFSYAESQKHYTHSGQKRIARGDDAEDHIYNVIFRPAA